MKKLLFISTAILLLASCTPAVPGGISSNNHGNTDPSHNSDTDSEDKYFVTREMYEREMDRDTVLFHSNYIVEMDTTVRSNPLISQFDNGKSIVNNSQYYEFTELDHGYVNMFNCNLDGTYPYERSMPKESLYLYWFMDFGFLFDVPFDELTYDPNTHTMVGHDFDVDQYHIESVTMSAYDGKPISMVFEITNLGTCTARFYNHGQVSITRPDIQTQSNQNPQEALSEVTSSASGGEGMNGGSGANYGNEDSVDYEEDY